MSKKEAPAWLIPIVNEMLVNEANASGIPLTHLCNSDRKTKPIAQARWRIMRRLRDKYVTAGGRTPGLIIERESFCQDRPRLSYPIIGWLLDVDHSAVHHAIANNKREVAKAAVGNDQHED